MRKPTIMSPLENRKTNISDVYNAIEEAFIGSANPEVALPMAAYMKNKFEFFGIKSQLRRALLQEVIRKTGRPKNVGGLALQFWRHPCREMQYAAIDILRIDKHYRNHGALDVYEELITSKSWWDTADILATRMVGGHVSFHPHEKERVQRWIYHEDMWLNRSAIIYQLHYGILTDTAFLTESILAHAGSREFFHQKAIGWALRQYSLKNPAWVNQFTKTHVLPALSLREALRKMQQTPPKRGLSQTS